MAEYTGKNGFYCCSYLTKDSIETLNKFLHENELKKQTPYEFHTTIMFSEVCPNKITRNISNISIHGIEFALLGDNLVMLVSSTLLNKRHQKWLQLGCKYTHDNYIPHITIIEELSKYNFPETKLQHLLSLNFNIPLQIGKEIISNLEN